jgi:hypothetical protein
VKSLTSDEPSMMAKNVRSSFQITPYFCLSRWSGLYVDALGGRSAPPAPMAARLHCPGFFVIVAGQQ